MTKFLLKVYKIFLKCGLLLSAVFLFLNGCEEDEAEPRDYPRLREVQIVNVSDSGATFMAELYSLGNEVIIDHGFVWGLDGSLDIRYADRVLLGKADAEGVFDAKIIAALRSDKDYFVKAFVNTDKRTVYSSVRKFKSLGSLGATITGFTPRSAGLRDTLEISGKNFSWVSYQNIIKIGSVTCFPLETTDSTIKVLVEPGLKTINNIISVDVTGSVSYFTRDTFKLIPPQMTDYYPKTAYWGDTLTITGDYLNALGYFPTDFVKIKNFNCRRVSSAISSKNILKILVPDEMNVVSGILSLEVGGFPFSSPTPFVLKEPYFTFSPLSGTWADILTLRGRFNGKASVNNVLFDGNPGTVVSSTNTELQVRVPYSLNSPECHVVLNTNPFNITSSANFRLLAPEISSFSPASGGTGAIITIYGKHFGSPARYMSPLVYFRDQQAEVTSFNDSTIMVRVPNIEGGQARIKVVVASMTAEAAGLFSVGNPFITSVHPLTGTFNDEITIEGANLISEGYSTQVFFDGFESEIVSLTATRVVVKVPVLTDSIPHNIRIYSGGNNCVSGQMFTLEPPVIDSFSPGSITPGSDVTIYGSNFNPVPGYNSVSWSGFPLTVKSSSPDQIIATWPEELVRTGAPLRITAGGYVRTSLQNITFNNSKWRKISSPVIYPVSEYYGYWLGDHLYGKALNGLGYIVNMAHIVYRFNPLTDEWTRVISTNPAMSIPHSSGEVVAGDSLYLISGYDSYSQSIIRKYTPSTNNWQMIPQGITGIQGVAFNLDNKIFFGLDNHSWSGKFYQIDIQANYNWIEINNFPQDLPSRFNTYFTVGNRGFVLFENGEVWEFNPSDLSWHRKNNFPGEPRNMSFSFELNGNRFIGGGNDGYNVFNDIWQYDETGDTWSLYTRMPVQRFGSVAFTISGKIYIGYGYNYDYGISPKMDFYEYDPAYPVY